MQNLRRTKIECLNLAFLKCASTFIQIGFSVDMIWFYLRCIKNGDSVKTIDHTSFCTVPCYSSISITGMRIFPFRDICNCKSTLIFTNCPYLLDIFADDHSTIFLVDDAALAQRENVIYCYCCRHPLLRLSLSSSQILASSTPEGVLPPILETMALFVLHPQVFWSSILDVASSVKVLIQRNRLWLLLHDSYHFTIFFW